MHSVKETVGLGTSLDVIVVNGRIREGDTIVLAGQEGPIVTTVRGILFPAPMSELRVKGTYEHLKEVTGAQGVKLIAKDLEKALAGLPLPRTLATPENYQLIRQVSGKPSTLSDFVGDVNGGFITENSAKVERWREHFEHYVNFDTQPTAPLLSSSAEFLPTSTYAVPCDPPSEGEVVDATRKLRNNKAPGEGGIPAEILKSCVQERAPLGIDVCQLEEVDSFKYLGARLLPNGQSKDKNVSLIDAARRVFSSLLKCLWIRRDISITTKVRMYLASVQSVLLYGWEC
nr:unnamed protein product [Spirometra erinaceieuropaei]